MTTRNEFFFVIGLPNIRKLANITKPDEKHHGSYNEFGDAFQRRTSARAVENASGFPTVKVSVPDIVASAGCYHTAATNETRGYIQRQ